MILYIELLVSISVFILLRTLWCIDVLLGETFQSNSVPVAQLVEHRTNKAKVMALIPMGTHIDKMCTLSAQCVSVCVND